MKSNNLINVSQAREAMDRFKMLICSEVGVNLQSGYNGHLTSREAGSVGGQMVKNMCPIRTVKFVPHNRIAQGAYSGCGVHDHAFRITAFTAHKKQISRYPYPDTG